MALIGQSYAPPGTYTSTVYNANTPQLNSTQRIAVLIGEGQEIFTQANMELHRGSSAVADDQVVGENISDQVTGTGRAYQLTYFPVVTGDGTGTVTTDPSKITVLANGLPVAVASLNGATGQFQTQSIIPLNTNVVVNYNFKKKDTYILKENATAQVPAIAALTLGGVLLVNAGTPGELGNLVTLALTQAATGAGVADAQAVSGQGSDAISIELRKTDNTVRTFSDLFALFVAGISTSDGGYLTASIVTQGSLNSAATAQVATHLAGGAGPSTASVFATNFAPIVDGTNGGVVTTAPNKVTVLVNSVPATVSAVDGANGLVTLVNPVLFGSSVEISYFTNNYQDTADQLPSANVASIVQIGYGPNRADFTQGTDFVLNGNAVSWGAAVNTAAGQSTSGFTPFDATVIETTLVDEKVFLRLLSGATSGRNSVFTLPDSPVDGSGLGRATDNPALVSVYVGTNPVTALQAGAVKVVRLSGSKAQVTLYNPPASGQNVYASYWRSTLNDHQFTLAVKSAGGVGFGSYSVTDELGAIAPVASVGVNQVTNANFTNTGIVWPYNTPDLTAALGGADETITVTFQNDGLTTVVTPPVQASLVVNDSNTVPRIQLSATTPGTAGNAVTLTLVGGPSGAADANAVTVNGSAISVETVQADNATVRTWQQIVSLFATYPVAVAGAGQIICTGVLNADLTPQATSLAATHFTGGQGAVTTPYANRFIVSTSRTVQQAAADGLGLTGGVGYLGQTYIDATTAVKFTIVDPQAALSYGYTQLPSPSYQYQPGDTLQFAVNKEAAHLAGQGPTIALPGLKTNVVSTLNMNIGDTAIISSFNRAGNTPNVGEYYYVTYTTQKTAADMAIQVFSKVSDAYTAFGQPNTTNRLSLGAQLFNQNSGGIQFAAIQVPADPQTGLATDQSFIDAIQTLATPLQGSGRKMNLIVPLSTSSAVQQALSQFLTIQATARNQGEATCVIGFDNFASASDIQGIVGDIANQRVVAVTPNLLGINIQAATDLTATEWPVTGEFLAAAKAGLILNANNDVATTTTGQVVTGFTRSLNVFDVPTLNQLAASGVTCLVDANGALEVRHYKTTDPSNALTSEPYVTTTADYINQSFRLLTKQFRGKKMTSDLPSTITAVLNGQLTAWLGSIISACGQLTVVPDAIDPTTIDIAVPVRPMFSALYFNVTLTVNLSQ